MLFASRREHLGAELLAAAAPAGPLRGPLVGAVRLGEGLANLRGRASARGPEISPGPRARAPRYAPKACGIREGAICTRVPGRLCRTPLPCGCRRIAAERTLESGCNLS